MKFKRINLWLKNMKLEFLLLKSYDFESNLIGNDFNKKILEFLKFLEDRKKFYA